MILVTMDSVSGRTVRDNVLVHSNEGTITCSPKTGKISKLKSGGHGQEGMDILKKQGITYNVVKTCPNGVRVGMVCTNGKIATVFPDSDQRSVLRRKR